jgi:pimeloyl-ACP methyl ester carboxylesterase
VPEVILRDGSRIHYAIADSTDPWVEPETVFLHHGNGKSGDYWLGWSRLLARHFRVIAIDMLGNGRSSRPRGHAWSIAGYAQDALEVMDALGVDRVHFVGEAMGGCVGLQVAATAPSRVRTLTLCATPFRPSEGTADPGGWGRRIRRGGLADFVDQTLPDRMDWGRFPPEMYAWYRAQRMSASPRIMAEQMAAHHEVDMTWALSRITMPTLLIIPGASPSNADRQMRQMAETIPDATVVEFPDERQWVAFSAADACVAAFLAFLAERSGAPA